MKCKERYLKHYVSVRHMLTCEIPKKLPKDEEFWLCIKYLGNWSDFIRLVECMQRFWPDVPFALLAWEISNYMLRKENILKDNRELVYRISNKMDELIDADVERFIRDEFKRKYDEANNKKWWKIW